MKTYTPAWMPVHSGGQFLFADGLQSNKLNIDDIAHSLSNQCRYNGHTKAFYSVAEHSVRVAEVLEYMHPLTDTETWMLAGLLHDAAEAYIGDIISPIKCRYFDSTVEHEIEELIAKQFDVPLDMLQSADVKMADTQLLVTEMRDLFSEEVAKKLTVNATPLRSPIQPWAPEIAKVAFLSLFQRLTHERMTKRNLQSP